MGKAVLTIRDLNQKIQDYIARGYQLEVYAAVRAAQIATRDFIARTYPKTAFSGKTLKDKYIIIGKYDIEASKTVANIYANYFSRWYNTGAFGRIIKGNGPRAGERGPKYSPHGNYFERNRAAIVDYFNKQIEQYLERHFKL